MCVATDNGDVIRCDVTSLAAAQAIDHDDDDDNYDYDIRSQRQASKSYIISRKKVVNIICLSFSNMLALFLCSLFFLVKL